MKAVTLPTFGDLDALVVAQVPDPTPAADEVVIKVHAAGVNRADLMQRQGLYPPPPGAPEYPGLEVSGTIDEVGAEVTDWTVGDEVCALLAGGGYAERVAVPSGQVLPVPSGVDLTSAAGIPEVACTVWSNIFMTAGLEPGQTVLFHGGASGIGTMGIQLAKATGSRVAVTAGSAEKLERCAELGADILINYREQDFVEAIREATDGIGADVILDVMGASYLGRNVQALAIGGRVVVIGFQGGVKGELNLAELMGKRGGVFSTSLRARSKGEKAVIVAEVRDQVWPLIDSGQVKPVIDKTIPLDDVRDAHRELEESANVGKVLLTL